MATPKPCVASPTTLKDSSSVSGIAAAGAANDPTPNPSPTASPPLTEFSMKRRREMKLWGIRFEISLFFLPEESVCQPSVRRLLDDLHPPRYLFKLEPLRWLE